MRLIDADDLINLINTMQMIDGNFNILDVIKNAPTISPEELKPLIETINDLLPELVEIIKTRQPKFTENEKKAFEKNTREILECNFSGFKDEFIEIATRKICECLED